MNEGNKEQLDQMLRGIYRMCVNRDDCSGCPFYITKCSFGEPKPSTWFDEETIRIQPEPVEEKKRAEKVPLQTKSASGLFLAHPGVKAEAEVKPAPETAPGPEEQKQEDDSKGTWLLSTTMGSVFSKYVFICSKCGYKRESLFSMTPMSYCPECAKRKANQGE